MHIKPLAADRLLVGQRLGLVEVFVAVVGRPRGLGAGMCPVFGTPECPLAQIRDRVVLVIRRRLVGFDGREKLANAAHEAHAAILKPCRGIDQGVSRGRRDVRYARLVLQVVQ
jgi:hypothetical protein